MPPAPTPENFVERRRRGSEADMEGWACDKEV